MGLQDPASETSARRRQSLPFFPGGPSSDSTSGNSDPTTSPSTNQDNVTPPSGQSPPSPNSPPDSSNPTPTTPNAAASSPPPSPTPTPTPTPTSTPGANNGGSPPNTSTPIASKSPNPPSPSPSPSATSSTPVASNTPTPVNPPKSDSSTTSAAASLPTHGTSNDSGLNTVTSVVSDNARPIATAHRNLPTSAPAAQPDNSSGLSGGAITGIAVVAGIIGFILLFWVGVQLLQSKRRRREEAEMQEIDFYPGGGGSVNGGMAYPRATGSLDRQPSASNSFNYNKPAQTHFAEPNYAEGMREEGEYIEPHANQEFDSGLQRQGTLGGSSAYSGGGYYANPVPVPPAPYANYSPYSNQFGPPQPIYEQHPYEYPHGRAPVVEYPPGHVQSKPPTSIEYQR